MQQMKVLVIEDNPGDARLIQEMFDEIKEFIFNAKFVNQLGDGLKYLSLEQPDLILSDLCLPDSNGIETFLKLIAAADDVPIILLTGEVNETYALIATKEGVGDYLIKGRVDAQSLKQAIWQATHRQRADSQE